MGIPLTLVVGGCQSYVDWLNYLIVNFFGPKHYHLTGCVLAIGESDPKYYGFYYDLKKFNKT